MERGERDSGVHALGQVIHFDLPRRGTGKSSAFARYPKPLEDIDFIRVEQVADDFHSRHAAAHLMNYRRLWSSPRTP